MPAIHLLVFFPAEVPDELQPASPFIHPELSKDILA
jgi:hypothetical protein